MNMTGRVIVSLMLTACVAATAANGRGTVHATRIVDNPDSSRTFVEPLVSLPWEDDNIHYGIRKGVPGACRLAGMSDFLSDYVAWSKSQARAIAVNHDGTVGDVLTGYYIESMTCIPDPPPLPVITASNIAHGPDGSVTYEMPVLHHGPGRFPIHSGHTGACRLLGYSKPVKYSLKWSEGRASSVSLDADGMIYTKVTGTYLTAMECTNDVE